MRTFIGIIGVTEGELLHILSVLFTGLFGTGFWFFKPLDYFFHDYDFIPQLIFDIQLNHIIAIGAVSSTLMYFVLNMSMALSKTKMNKCYVVLQPLSIFLMNIAALGWFGTPVY